MTIHIMVWAWIISFKVLGLGLKFGQLMHLGGKVMWSKNRSLWPSGILWLHFQIVSLSYIALSPRTIKLTQLMHLWGWYQMNILHAVHICVFQKLLLGVGRLCIYVWKEQKMQVTWVSNTVAQFHQDIRFWKICLFTCICFILYIFRFHVGKRVCDI